VIFFLFNILLCLSHEHTHRTFAENKHLHTQNLHTKHINIHARTHTQTLTNRLKKYKHERRSKVIDALYITARWMANGPDIENTLKRLMPQTHTHTHTQRENKYMKETTRARERERKRHEKSTRERYVTNIIIITAYLLKSEMLRY